jgi:nucleotidyltransferase/DNA polymerase involved in DNA repair
MTSDCLAARAAGVTRHMRVAEAINICPELQLVHVQTIGEWSSFQFRQHSVTQCR